MTEQQQQAKSLDDLVRLQVAEHFSPGSGGMLAKHPIPGVGYGLLGDIETKTEGEADGQD